MSFKIGDITGNYEIVGVLGSGGMGKVYKVRNTLSDRFDAMKVLLPDLNINAELADRFLREIKVQARLNHPNIASLHTALHVDNQLLMIMELVEGNNLEEEIRRGSISHQDAEAFLIQILSALDYAHKNGVIHRDIKPANIILTPSGQAKLMDFGIARVAADRSLTKTGIALGTLFYLSPEQIRGDGPDARTDIYALGITFYEVLTGKRPIDGDSDYSIMTAHLEHVPQSPVELNPSVPPALAGLILRALAKSPGDRFQTAAEFLAALLDSKQNLQETVRIKLEVTRAAPLILAPGKVRTAVWIAAAAMVLLGGLAIAKFSGNRTSSSPPVVLARQPSSAVPAAPANFGSAASQEPPGIAAYPAPAPAAVNDRFQAASTLAATTKVPVQSPAVPAPSRPPTQQVSTLPAAGSHGGAPQLDRAILPSGQSQPSPGQSQPSPGRSQKAESGAPQSVPSAPAAKDTRVVLQEDWDRLSNSKDISALQDFQRKHADSPFAAQAAARIELHSWEIVTGSKDAKALRAYLAQFPGGAHAAHAAAELDALDGESNGQAITDTLRGYRAAYESRDTAGIQSLWPSLGHDDLAKIDGFFKATRSAKMVLQPVGQPKFAGDTASIACVRSVTVQMKDGTRQRPIDQNVTVRLKKSGAAWVITALE